MSEQLVVVDEHDNFIRNAPRSEVHKSREWHRGVHSFLFNSRGELLLLLRSATKDKYPMHWECAISEHVDPGESYEAALRRGLKEELGANPGWLKKLVKFRMEYGPTDLMVVELYEGRLDSVPKVNRDEAERAEFVPIERISDEIDDGKYTPWFREMFKHYTGAKSHITVMK